MAKPRSDKLSTYIFAKGLRATNQRDIIFKVFTEAGKHLSAEELHARIRKSNPGISYATVYRTLKLLSEAGLAKEHRFEDGFTRYEQHAPDVHHDHLICTRCGAILEFENDRIEALQLEVAKKNGFRVQSHKLEIYGQCPQCLKKTSG
jgi:Fur family ferric uptake transcriptional regulator